MKPLFEKVACQQGFTLRESLSGQLMHSRVGPWLEANQVYVEQSDLRQTVGSVSPFVLYDVGMGTGANALAFMEKWRALNIPRPLHIVSFERYPETLEAAVHHKLDFLESWKSVVSVLVEFGLATAAGIEWRLVRGDFREVDFAVLPKPDLVFFDFYSPGVCPELWTEELFSRLNKAPRLITYASSKTVRVAMLLAGFYVGKGASTTMKLETTIAGSIPVENMLGRDWLESLARSPKGFPMERLRAHPQFNLSPT